LRPHLRTGVTIWYPSSTSPAQLAIFNKLHKNFCKEKRIPARGVWEGPGPHIHIALGISHEAGLEQKWKSRLGRAWQRIFGKSLPDNAFLWNADEEPEKLASYESKTRDTKGQIVKGKFPWLTFKPTWETGFACRLSMTTPPRKKRVESSTYDTTEKERHADSPHYTRESTEKESEPEPIDQLASLRALSPVSPSGGTVKVVYGLLRAMPHRMLSLRLDRGGLEIATQLHFSQHLRLVCTPPSSSVLHMLIAEGSSLPANLRIRLQAGSAMPRTFEVIYMEGCETRLHAHTGGCSTFDDRE
jgi:hypothetical protein